jgi:hypothetical protein|tara:strand:+ start:340 stop:594 length:255 start_codon:yes stop_codon:yes gene_type:complete
MSHIVVEQVVQVMEDKPEIQVDPQVAQQQMAQQQLQQHNQHQIRVQQNMEMTVVMVLLVVHFMDLAVAAVLVVQAVMAHQVLVD